MGVSLRLSVNFVALFWVVGIYIPFLPVWLEGRGLSAERIGMVLALAIAPLACAARGDRGGSPHTPPWRPCLERMNDFIRSAV